MRRTLCACTLLAALAAPVCPGALAAQRGDTTRRDTLPVPELPRHVAREVMDAFNGPVARRGIGRTEIAEGEEVPGDLAVLGGPLVIAGHVAGGVVAVNTDVALRPTARVDGDILVVGGAVTGTDSAYVGGEIRSYREPLQYRQEEGGERIIIERELPPGERWWRRSGTEEGLRFGVTTARTYNRVEGLPIYLGPTWRTSHGWGQLVVDANGIVRTDQLDWKGDDFGHLVTGELRLGSRRGVALGGKLYDTIDPVEDWQLSREEVGLAAFFLHRDYRDYFNRHGGQLYARVAAGPDADLTLGYGYERWASRGARDPFTVFRNGQPWRPNPQVQDGRLHVADATLRVDTRTDLENPWAGWYVVADVERGLGRDPTSNVVDVTIPPRPVLTSSSALLWREYTRGFLDVRRYNRLSPGTQLNMRLVLGGWLGGDKLPLERRFSVGGPGTIPGFDFRRFYAADGGDFGAADIGSCNTAAYPLDGHPALCDRVALGQLEYRSDVRIGFINFLDRAGLRTEAEPSWIRSGLSAGASWVVFLDGGRGWLVGDRQGELQYPSGSLPPLGTFRTDAGLGLDFGWFGVYVAKALSVREEPANFFVRVRHRF